MHQTLAQTATQTSSTTTTIIIMFKWNMKFQCRWFNHFDIHRIIRSGTLINGLFTIVSSLAQKRTTQRENIFGNHLHILHSSNSTHLNGGGSGSQKFFKLQKLCGTFTWLEHVSGSLHSIAAPVHICGHVSSNILI